MRLVLPPPPEKSPNTVGQARERTTMCTVEVRLHVGRHFEVENRVLAFCNSCSVKRGVQTSVLLVWYVVIARF